MSDSASGFIEHPNAFVDPGFSWRTNPASQGLDWFGLTNAPGITVAVGARLPVPERATATIPAAGVFELALARRSRT